MSKRILCHLFGFKVTEQTGPNQIAVRFVKCVSDKPPSKADQRKKDFWHTEVREGDFCSLYADAAEVETSFQKEKADVLSSDFYDEEWAKRRGWFEGVCTREQWNVLTALAYAWTNFSLGRLIIENSIIADILRREANVDDADVAVALFEQFQEVNLAIYDAELAEFAKAMVQ